MNPFCPARRLHHQRCRGASLRNPSRRRRLEAFDRERLAEGRSAAEPALTADIDAADADAADADAYADDHHHDHRRRGDDSHGRWQRRRRRSPSPEKTGWACTRSALAECGRVWGGAASRPTGLRTGRFFSTCAGHGPAGPTARRATGREGSALPEPLTRSRKGSSPDGRDRKADSGAARARSGTRRNVPMCLS